MNLVFTHSEVSWRARVEPMPPGVVTCGPFDPFTVLDGSPVLLFAYAMVPASEIVSQHTT